MNLEEAKANIGAEVELDESTKPYTDADGVYGSEFSKIIEENKTFKICGTGGENVIITQQVGNCTNDVLIKAKHLKLKPQNYKIHVPTEEESKEAQELFFELGYECHDGEEEFVNTDVPYIYANSNLMEINLSWIENFFELHQAKQITLQDLRDMVAKKRMKEFEEKQRLVCSPISLEDIAEQVKNMALKSIGVDLASDEDKTVKSRIEPSKEMTWQDAFRAVADGKEVVFHNNFTQQWESINELQVFALIGSKVRFRLAPQRITLNGEYTKEELLQKIGEIE